MEMDLKDLGEGPVNGSGGSVGDSRRLVDKNLAS